MPVRFGLDRLVDDPALLGNVKRVALTTNNAARTAAGVSRPGRVALLNAGVPIVRLFTPEHGLSANAADGAAVADHTDELTGMPVVSLYGEQFAPPPESLRDLDAVLFDIPDVGVRFYTYIWTLTHVIDACAAARVPVFVLDRPNPLGGALQTVEGPLLDPALASFIGRHSIPIRHSLTLGEFARLWRAERCPAADVRVIACEGWQRHQLWRDTDLPFVPTSPAITRFEAALLYAGICLFEATNLSVGRGSPYSFEVVGAPWLEAAELATRLNQRGFVGIYADAVEFVPGSGPHSGHACNGVRIIARAAGHVRPVRIALALLAEVIALHPRDFKWSKYVTAANPAGHDHFERLFGVRGVRELLGAAAVDDPTLNAWTGTPGWAERWRNAHLYQ